MSNINRLGMGLFTAVRDFSDRRPFKQHQVTIYVSETFFYQLCEEVSHQITFAANFDYPHFEGHPVYVVTDERHPEFKFLVEEKEL